MASIGGAIESVAIRGRLFAVAADADATLKLGGRNNEIQMNGDTTGRVIQTVVPWMTEGLEISIDNDRGDMEFLQEIADDGIAVPIATTLAGGAVYQGKGLITGEFSQSSQKSTCSLTLSGPGKQEQQ